jgi:uncharacterized Zn finger protein
MWYSENLYNKTIELAIEAISSESETETLTCKECGANFNKEISVISGDDGYEHCRHIRCLRCGAIVAEFVQTTKQLNLLNYFLKRSFPY